MRNFTKKQKEKITKYFKDNLWRSVKVLDAPTLMVEYNKRIIPIIITDESSAYNRASIFTLVLRKRFNGSDIKFDHEWHDKKNLRAATEDEIKLFMSGRNIHDTKREFRANDIYKLIDNIKLD